MLRHSGAGHCRFELSDGDGELVLTVADAIREVVNGATVIDPELAGAALRTATSPLTSRERPAAGWL